MTTKEFLKEAVERLEKSKVDVLYLHPDNVGQAECALVTMDWINRHAKAEAALYAAYQDIPDTTNHDHLTEEE